MYLSEPGILCALGVGADAVLSALLAGDQSGMVASDAYSPGRPNVQGPVPGPLPSLSDDFSLFDCRHNALLLAAAQQIDGPIRDAIERYGRDRVGVVLGTSTSGVEECENMLAVRETSGEKVRRYHYQQQRLSGPSDFLASYLEVDGPAMTISTACSSSAHVFGVARGMIAMGLCEAVIVGGADALSRLPVQGFLSLEAVSRGLCNPLSVNRDGINIGEGAALTVMSGEPSEIALLGFGSSSDAHHISAPDPSGAGAMSAMRSALADAGLAPAAIDYVNLHGTGTPLNDSMETRAMVEVLSADVACSSTKPLTGHTLGAAGAVELMLCWLVLSDQNRDGRCPPHCWDAQRDPELPRVNVVDLNYASEPKTCLSNSFAFGGNNVSLIIGRVD